MLVEKLIKDLKIGDLIADENGNKFLRLMRKNKSSFFKAKGGCFMLDMIVSEGKEKGLKVLDQYFAGDMIVLIKETNTARDKAMKERT
jgi:hypothetical protein